MSVRKGVVAAVAGALGLDALRQSLDGVRGEYRRITDELESLRRIREEIAAAPLAAGDLIAFVHRWVDDTSNRYRDKLADRFSSLALVLAAETPDALEDPRAVTAKYSHLTKLAGIDLSPHARGDSDGVVPGALLLMLGTDAVKVAFAQVIEQLPPGGMPLKTRVKRLAELDQQIDDGEAKLLELRRTAADAGILLESRR
jgi:hypothetical protein